MRHGGRFLFAMSGSGMVWVATVVALLLAACIALRSFELDEGYSFLILSGHPRLVWPDGVFDRADVADWFSDQASLPQIADALRRFDVHPPLWFCTEQLWRRLFGPGLIAARALSAVFALASIPLMAAIARRCAAPPVLTCLLTFLSYDAVYTGSTVRMYPMALWLLLLGLYATLRLMQASGGAVWRWAMLAGLGFGCAFVTHFLTCLVAAAVLAVPAARIFPRRGFLPLLSTGAVMLPFIVWGATFYVVQDRRAWQFPPFGIASMSVAVARNFAAAVTGSLPLQFTGFSGLALGALISLVLAAAVGLAAVPLGKAWRVPEIQVIVAGMLALPVGLFAIALAFGREAIEPRYLAYAVPFLALFVARGLRNLRVPRLAVLVALALLAVQVADAMTLPLTRAAQQTARAAIAEIGRHWAPRALLILPEADDTSGMTADFLFEAPPGWPIYLTHDGDAPRLREVLAGREDVYVILQADNAGHRALDQALATLAALHWRDTGSDGVSSRRFGQVWTHFVHTAEPDKAPPG